MAKEKKEMNSKEACLILNKNSRSKENKKFHKNGSGRVEGVGLKIFPQKAKSPRVSPEA